MRIQRLGDLLGGHLRRLGVERNVQAARVVDAANRVLRDLYGLSAARDLWAQTFTRSELTIAFVEPMAAARVRSESTEILRQLHSRLPDVRVSRIRLVPATNRP